MSWGGPEDKRENFDNHAVCVKERPRACGAPEAETSLMGCPLEPGLSQSLAMALFSSPMPHHDISLSETGSGQGARERAWIGGVDFEVPGTTGLCSVAGVLQCGGQFPKGGLLC